MIRIRPAGPMDAGAIAHVQVETWRDTYAGILPDHVLLRMSEPRECAMWRRVLASPDIVLVAEEDSDGVIGFASAGPNRQRSLAYSGEVYTLYVLPGRQGQGLGRRLLHRQFGALKRAGHGSAVLWVLDANPARYFYEAMGGTRVAERDEPLWGTVLHEAAYGWAALPVPRGLQ
ncbi:MAG: N-acetyltransferase family protein [Alphaproteobacteria bacterium]